MAVRPLAPFRRLRIPPSPATTTSALALALLSTAVLLFAPTSAASQDAEPSAEPETNPFAGFETHYLSNGMKVWYQQVPEDPDFYTSVIVPYGSDADFHGKEEIAHFLEHMLFSDHMGRTEEEIKREIEDRGGRRNGMTSADRTLYYAAIEKEHGFLALDWLYRIVSPHEMDPEVVERGRQPVALEIGARPREFFDWIGAYVIDPPWLRVKGFWEKEFGMETRQYRWYDRYESLYAITPEDLRAFYDTYYVPSRMTLVVVGDLDRDSVLAQAEATFGTLPSRPAPVVEESLADPGRYRQAISWNFLPSVAYDTRFKIYDLTGESHLKALFIQDLLLYRLNQRLRYGERKAIYGVSVAAILRGPAAYLRISAQINEDELDFAEGVIQEELDFLRQGSLPADEFELARSTLVTRLIRENRRPEALGAMAGRGFYKPELHTDFPDLVGFYQGVTQTDLATFSQELFAPERQIHQVTYRQPISQGAMVLVAILVVALTIQFARWIMTAPIQMPRIRYVARFKRSLLARVLGFLVITCAMAVLYRIGGQGVALLWTGFVSPVPSYLVQHLFIWLVVALAILGVIGSMAWMPSKLLVFDDHLLIKYRAYRSRRIAFSDLKSISAHRLGGFLSRGGPLRFRALTLALIRPGVLLEPANGRGYFFRVRNPEELISTVDGLREKPVAPSGGVDPSVPSAIEQEPPTFTDPPSPADRPTP